MMQSIVQENRLLSCIQSQLSEFDSFNFNIAISNLSVITTPTSAVTFIPVQDLAPCHHLASLLTGGCSILCDDYVDQSPGLCYLKLFSNRVNIFMNLGFLPTMHQLLKHKNHEWWGKTISYGRILHVGGPPESSVIIKIDLCLFCKSGTRSSCEYFEPDESYRCKKCSRMRRVYYTVREGFKHFRVGALIGFGLKKLIENCIPVSTFTCEPGKLGIHETTTPFQGSVFKEGNQYTITIGPYKKTGSVEDIKNMVHDFVASCWEQETDEKLGILGIEYPGSEMTPDGINTHNRNVIELGTSFISNESYLKSEFRGKVFKYEQELSKYPVKLNILIVSFTQTFSNLPLTEMQCLELCSRYTMAKPLEAMITEMEGYDVFANKDSSDVKLVKKTIKSITGYGIDSDTYKIDEILAFNDPLSSMETMEAKSILTNEFKKTETIIQSTKKDLDSYCSKFTPENSRMDMKRVTNIPCVMHSGNKSTQFTTKGSDLPKSLLRLWVESNVIKRETVNLIDLIESGMNNSTSGIQHLSKLKSTFKFTSNHSEAVELNLLGLGKKELKDDPQVKNKYKEGKKSFHPFAPTHDIDDFHSRNWFRPLSKDEHKFENDELVQAVRNSKFKSTGAMGTESLDIWDVIRNTELFNYSMMISEIFFELAINYKQWTKPGTFLKKETKSGIQMIIYNPKGHVFVSFGFPRDSEILSTGRIGPNLFSTESHYITDFCSFNEPTIEHFTKAGPYMGGIIAHLMTGSSTRGEITSTVKEIAPKIFLLYMNNKTDVEELITSQRYFFMKLMEDVGNGSFNFTSRLPEVLRSRLTSHYAKKTMNLMSYYGENDIIKVPKKENSIILYDYLNLKSVFTEGDVTLEELINTFYFGYVISKERGRGNNRTFKVLKKLLQQEFNFRDTVKVMFSNGLKTPKYTSNRSLLKVFSHLFSSLIKNKLGDNFKETLFNNFCSEVAHTNFSVLATLKASSRKHPEDFKVPIVKSSQTSKEIFEELKKLNPEEIKKRPKVLEALIDLVNDYKKATGATSIEHEVELLPWCLQSLLKKGYFDSDCFAKPQHGGDREIHVLEIMARLVQFHLEQVAKVYCKFFPSETTTNPDTKKYFVSSHYQRSRDMLKTNYFVTSKSADATKWCQCHHVSHFAAMFSVILPEELKPLMISGLSLWPHKNLSFPLQQIADFMKNPDVETNETYKRFSKESATGTGIFRQKNSNKINLIAGMLQGLLHVISSLYHTMIQECMKIISSQMLDDLGLSNHLITVIQGSDDSGMMLTLPGPMSPEKVMLARRILQYKENVSSHLSIYNSVDKSSIGTLDLIEYNSEWYIRHKIVKPTFRWISAAFTINVTERFIDRVRNFNSVLSECLAGGAATLECAVIQLFQCMLHYMLLGMFVQATSKSICSMITVNPDPLLGFFPCDFDVSAGITGVEFSLYSLYMNSSYGRSIKNRFDTDIELSYASEEMPSSLQTKDLKSVRLKMGHMSIYEKLVKNISLGTYEEAVTAVELDPYLVWGRHTSWEEEKPNLVLKVFSPGVKESLSNVSPSLRMIAASAYLHIFPCLSKWENDKAKKCSLLYLLHENNNNPNLSNSKPPVESLFPLSNEFSRLYKSILAMINSMSTINVKLRKVSKATVLVFEPPSDQLPLVDMCKRQWLNIGKIPLSRSQTGAHWISLCEKFPFISPVTGIQGLYNTAANLKCTVIELKTFLESLTLRAREIKLQDTEAKGKDVIHVMSRIYWPNTQIRHTREGDEIAAKVLRSNLVSISTYWQVQSSLTRMAKEVLLDSKILSKHYQNIPNSIRKLKIMRDFLSGDSKLSLLRRIEHLKIGVIGVFTKIQGGYGDERKGTGLWRGRVCGIDCEIKLNGTECEQIKVKALGDTRSLGLTLVELLREFGSKPPARKSKLTDYAIESSGRIVSRSKSDTFYPLVVDRDMEPSIISDVEDMQWDVEMAPNQNVRLIVYDARRRRVEKLTILSDSLSSRDWTPSSPAYLDDGVLVHWSEGSMCPTELLESQILKNFPKTRWEFSLGNWRKIENTHPWDLNKFKDQILKHIMPNYKPAPSRSEIKDAEITEVEFKEFRQLTSNLWDVNEKDLEDHIGNWADLVNEESDTLPTIESANEDQINDLVKMFLNVQNVDEEYLSSVDKRGGMPTSLQFFSSIETLCQLQTKKSLKECLISSSNVIGIKYKGILGKIMSIMTGIWMYDSDLEGEEDASKWEAESIAITESIMNDDDLMGLPLTGIDSKIDDLQFELERSSGIVKNSLIDTLDRYLRIRLLKTQEENDELEENKEEYLEEFFKTNTSILEDFPKSRKYWKQFLNIKVEEFLSSDLNNKKITNVEYQRSLISMKSSKLTERYKMLLHNFLVWDSDSNSRS